jgi:hypothetical protein
MKRFVFIFFLLIAISCTDKEKKDLAVEVSCGQCQFDLTGQKGCDLAVRFEGKAYFVDGAHIDDFGDAHDKQTGFCEVIRQGKASGTIKENRFQVTSLELTDEK